MKTIIYVSAAILGVLACIVGVTAALTKIFGADQVIGGAIVLATLFAAVVIALDEWTWGEPPWDR